MKKLLCLILPIIFLTKVSAQKIDTVKINASNINTKVLIAGQHQWLVYFKNGKDSSRVRFSIWNRRIDLIKYEGKDAISVTQKWESNDTVTHTAYTVCDRSSFAPLYHEVWWRKRGSGKFNFVSKEMEFNGKPTTAATASEAMKPIVNAFDQATKEYNLIWHLDLETFPQLPYKDNTAFVINFYDPGFPTPPKPMVYTVIGSSVITGYDGQKIECWKLAHGSLPASYEVFYINKKTKEVMKLEQEFNGKFRYKIKLAYITN